ncbi:receptor-type tyrosine-protein phosphatase F-like isoform X2 [Penaeus chinensis]|uniref:receptor-type tyrosine-protein phosphatase F-like isoform X2 n=1 Tax=Penaeus chinensis TaxID=139456 RepID=UPI001FB67EC7|nr:receptor-type tyrosine-protein phosphatase F-like isoform X2 [Penaeus chinensis]
MSGIGGRMGEQGAYCVLVVFVACLNLVQTEITTEPTLLTTDQTITISDFSTTEFSDFPSTKDFAMTTNSAETTSEETTIDVQTTTVYHRPLTVRSVSLDIEVKEVNWNVTVSWANSSEDSNYSYNVTVKCVDETEKKAKCGCLKCEEFHETTEKDYISFVLRPATNYSIEVIDLNSTHNGSVFYRTRPEEVLHFPNVTLSTKRKSVDFEWKINCPYTVPATYSILFNGTSITPKTGNCSHKVHIPGLKPFTNYTYWLQCLGEKNCPIKDCPGESSVTPAINVPSGSCQGISNDFRTLPDVPSKPRSLAVHGPPFDNQNNESSIAKIVWKVPEFANGILHEYLITIDLDGQNIINRPVKATVERVSLRPETSYRICVKARNKEPKEYGLKNCKNTTTNSGIPFFTGQPWYGPDHKISTRYFIHINSSAFDESNGKIRKQEVLFAKADRELKVVDVISQPLKNHSSFEFENLEPGTKYKFAIRISTTDGAKMSDIYTFQTEDAPISRILVAFLTIFVVALAAVAVIVIYNRRFSHVKASTSMELPLVVTYPPDVATERRILVSSLLDTVTELHNDGGQQLIREYNELKSISPAKSTYHASLGINDYKNRYINILPFDDSRVILNEYRGIPGSDYVNASYIHGYSKPKEFIASQGPKEELKEDFWRLVWEKNVHVIVMVTQCVEANKDKCCPYWPSASNVQGWRLGFSKLHVRTVLEVNHQPGGYITRKFELSKGSRTRVIQHFHYVSWPDMGCPQTPDQLIQFVKVVRAAIPRESSHTLIHCSAGVGRTGTFIALSNLMDEMEADGSVDVFHCVYRMRHHRTNMVQTQSQYSFVYKCILKHYLDSIGESDKYCLEDSESASLNTNVSVIQDNPYFMKDEYREDEGLIPFTDDEEEDDDEKEKEKKKGGGKDKAKVHENEQHEEEKAALIEEKHDDNVKANGMIKNEENSECEWEDINIEENEKNGGKEGENKVLQLNGN